jgi:hypothetical protein
MYFRAGYDAGAIAPLHEISARKFEMKRARKNKVYPSMKLSRRTQCGALLRPHEIPRRGFTNHIQNTPSCLFRQAG